MEPTTTSPEYKAPYIRLPEGQTTNCEDIIFFRKGHTLEKHREAIGRTDDGFRGRYQSYILQRFPEDDDELECILRDPGVEKVMQVTYEMEKAIRKEDRAVVTFIGSNPSPKYRVYFTPDNYAIEEHFARIGERFNNVDTDFSSGYAVVVPQSKLDTIFSDPHVDLIERVSYLKEDEYHNRATPHHPPPFHPEAMSGTQPRLADNVPIRIPSEATTGYLAPYYPLPDGQTSNRREMIFLRDGYDAEKHFETTGLLPKYCQYSKRILQRYIDDQEDLLRVRKDPGVEKVMQVTLAMELAARKEDRSLVVSLGYDAGPGYIVMFTDGSYTLEKHFERIGQRFDNAVEFTECGYYVDVPESELEKIFADPNVNHIHQNTYARLA